MWKACALTLSVMALAGCSGGAPSEDEVKRALYERYATPQGEVPLSQALNQEVAVKDCTKAGDEYRCLIENKDLGSSIPMYFAYDKAQSKWRFTKEAPN